MMEKSGDGRRAWGMVAIVFVTVGFSGAVWHMFGIFVKPLEAEFDLTRTSVSLVVTLSQGVYFCMMMMVGKILHRFGPKALIVTGMAVLGTGSILSGSVQSIGQMYLAYGVVLAAGYSVATINVSSIAVTQWFSRNRGLALGVALAGFNAGQLVILPFTQYWVLHFGWRNAFYLVGVVTLLLPLPLAVTLLRNGPYRNEDTGTGLLPRVGKAGNSLRESLKRGSFWFLAVSFFACGFSDFVLAAHLPPFAIDVGISPFLSGSAHGIISGISIVGVIVLGALSDRVGRRYPLTFIYVVRAVCFLFLPWIGGYLGLWIFILLYGFFYFATTPMTSAAASDIFPPDQLGTLYGYIIAAHGLGALSGPFVAGVIFDTLGSYTLAFLITGLVLLLGAVCCALIDDPIREARQSPT